MKAYRWLDGPMTISRVANQDGEPIELGGVINLTDAQLEWFTSRGFSFAEDAPEPAADSGKERAKRKTTESTDE